MFGISWAEFFVILLVAVVVVPARMWPDVARAVARVVRFVREIIWKVTDASESLKQQIELEQPLDQIIQSTTNDVLDSISTVLPKKKRKSVARKNGAAK